MVDSSKVSKTGSTNASMAQLSDNIGNALKTQDMSIVDFAINGAGQLSRELSTLNTSPVINQDLHDLIDRINNKRLR